MGRDTMLMRHQEFTELLPPLQGAGDPRFPEARGRALARNGVGLGIAFGIHLLTGLLLFSTWKQAPETNLPDPPPVLLDLPPLPPPAPVRQNPPIKTTLHDANPDSRNTPLDSPLPPMLQPIANLPANAVSLPDLPDQRLDLAPPPASPSRQGEESYEGLLLARIEQFKSYPSEAQRRGLEGRSRLRFHIDREGHLLDASILASSGHAALDREALATLRRAEPLPPIPADRPDRLEVTVPIEFFLNRVASARQ